VVLARAAGGDVVRIEEPGKNKKSTAQSLDVANFGLLRRAQLQMLTTTETQKGLKPDFREAVLFLKRQNQRWWILETIPRARAANGCIWVRGDKPFWYSRNPWPNGPQLVERQPGSGSVRGRGEQPTTSVAELLGQVRAWQADLARLRQIDQMTSPIEQMRALRAFMAPSTQPPHSPESLALARQVYREVIGQLEALRSGKKPGPVADSAWPAVRGASSPTVLQARTRLTSSSLAARTAGLQQLWWAANPEVTDAALKALGETSPPVCLVAATVLADFADAACSKTLIASYQAASKDLRNPLRAPLLRALATSEEPNAVAELIFALQEPEDPSRDLFGQLLVWLSGYHPNQVAAGKSAKAAYQSPSPLYLSPVAWQRWYEKRYGRKLQLKPWDVARLTDWIERHRGRFVPLPPSEMSLIPAQTIDEILGECAKPSLPDRDRWCDLLLRCWEAGLLNRQQQRQLLETFGRGAVEMRRVYPAGTTVLLGSVRSWPSTINFPPLMRFVSTSQLYVDGIPVGRPYPYPYPAVYLPRFCPGDFPPGKHRCRITTDYVVRVGKAGATSATVSSPKQEFEVAYPNQNVGLEAKTDPQLDAQVRRAFRFVTVQDVPGTSVPTMIVREGPRTRRMARIARRYTQPGGGLFEISGGNRWELAEKMPVDLAFDSEYEMLDFGAVLEGPPVYIPQGTTTTAEVSPFAYRYRLSAMEKPGTYRFRVHLTPSRDVALAQPECRAYWAGLILSSPVMRFSVTPVPAAPPPPAKKP